MLAIVVTEFLYFYMGYSHLNNNYLQTISVLAFANLTKLQSLYDTAITAYERNMNIITNYILTAPVVTNEHNFQLIYR